MTQTLSTTPATRLDETAVGLDSLLGSMPPQYRLGWNRDSFSLHVALDDDNSVNELIAAIKTSWATMRGPGDSKEAWVNQGGLHYIIKSWFKSINVVWHEQQPQLNIPPEFEQMHADSQGFFVTTGADGPSLKASKGHVLISKKKDRLLPDLIVDCKQYKDSNSGKICSANLLKRKLLLMGPVQLFYLREQKKKSVPAYAIGLTHYHATIYKFTWEKHVGNQYQVLYDECFFPGHDQEISDAAVAASREPILKLKRVINQINVERAATWKLK